MRPALGTATSVDNSKAKEIIVQTHRIVSALVIGFTLVGCAAAQEDGSERSEETATTASKLTGFERPGPSTSGGLPPKFVPPVDPLLDPIEGTVKPPLVVADDGSIPWKLLTPVGKGKCDCQVECAIGSNGKQQCITVCRECSN